MRREESYILHLSTNICRMKTISHLCNMEIRNLTAKLVPPQSIRYINQQLNARSTIEHMDGIKTI